MSFQIALDGPAGAGKSTVAKAVAAALQFIYIDTGAMYRAMGLYFDSLGIDLDDESAIDSACPGASVTIAHQEGSQHIFLNGEDVTTAVRAEKAGMLASKTSAYGSVRRKLTSMQQEIAKVQNVVMDGRDIGTAVLPEAPLKVYLTASVEERARRRYLELKNKGQDPDLAEIAADIEQRDYQDMHREIAPLCQAEDAVYLDSSDLTAEQVVEKIVSLARERMNQE
ncbi:MAG: (d)CMP kinase [Lachnospiraceae bacterium]|nr:(d)CMP kinase [Lachnospiraceae bacterium]